jgi:hypothetical protein
MCVCVCVVLSCVGRGLGAGLIPRPRGPTNCLKGSIRNKKFRRLKEGIRKKRKKKKITMKDKLGGCSCRLCELLHSGLTLTCFAGIVT